MCAGGKGVDVKSTESKYPNENVTSHNRPDPKSPALLFRYA